MWNSERASLPEQWSGNIDADWELLSSSFFNALAKTQFTLDPESIRKIPAALLRRGKPTRVSTRRVEILTRLKAGHLATFQERSLSNLVARLKEAQLYLDHPQAESLASSKDVQKLWARIQRSPHYDPTQGIQRNLLRVKRQLQQCISSADAQRLARWKDKMQDDKEALKWLHRNQAPPIHAVKMSHEHTPGTTIQNSLGQLRGFWQNTWNRPIPDINSFWKDYVSQTPAQPVQNDWPDLQADQVKQAIKRVRGSAPGLDGWTADELARLTDDMLATLISFFHHYENLGQIPTSWKLVRQVHLPKGQEDQPDGSALAEDLRPVSITSLWWRVLNGSRFRQPETQAWLSQSLPPYIFGGLPGKGVEDAIAPLLIKDLEGWTLASLDLAKAFDYTHPSLVCRNFRHLGMPPKVCNMPGHTKCDISNT